MWFIAMRHLIATVLLLLANQAMAVETTPAPGTQFIVQSDQTVIVPDSIGTNFEQANKAFSYDWTQYASIAAAQKKIPHVEALLSQQNKLGKLTDKEKQQAGELLLKLGAYYTNTGRPDLAIPVLTKADSLLTSPADKAKTYNQLAFAHERNFATSKNGTEATRTMTYTNKVIHEIYPNTKNTEVAFAYCIQGLTQNNANQLAMAEANFRNAVAIYAALPDNMSEMAARAKNKYAAILLTKPGREHEAIAQLEQAKKFWMTQENIYQTPYAARNFIMLGKAYLKINNAKGACDEANRGLPIYKSIYGANNKMLEQPYQLLASCYEKIGDTNMAATYKMLLNELKKSS